MEAISNEKSKGYQSWMPVLEKLLTFQDPPATSPIFPMVLGGLQMTDIILVQINAAQQHFHWKILIQTIETLAMHWKPTYYIFCCNLLLLFLLLFRGVEVFQPILLCLIVHYRQICNIFEECYSNAMCGKRTKLQ